ncbi:MAG: D-arabinono-1,4-lactone oxidase, partial [Pseudomonadales bacterium]
MAEFLEVSNYTDVVPELNRLIDHNYCLRLFWFSEDGMVVQSMSKVKPKTINKIYDSHRLSAWDAFKHLMWFGKAVGGKALKPFFRAGRSDEIFCYPPNFINSRILAMFRILQQKINFGPTIAMMNSEYSIPMRCAEDFLKEMKMFGHPSTFLHEIRFIKKDEIWLSPSYHEDMISVGIYAKGYQYKGDAEWLKVFKDFERLVKKY